VLKQTLGCRAERRLSSASPYTVAKGWPSRRFRRAS